MGDPQAVKAKGSYKHWSEPETKMLLRMLVEAMNQGHKFTRPMMETRILPELNEKLGTNKTYDEYMNRMKNLKKKYQNLVELLRFSSGFGWNPETMKLTSTDEVWEEYLKVTGIYIDISLLFM